MTELNSVAKLCILSLFLTGCMADSGPFSSKTSVNKSAKLYVDCVVQSYGMIFGEGTLQNFESYALARTVCEKEESTFRSALSDDDRFYRIDERLYRVMVGL